MGVTAEVAEHVLIPAEGAFGVYHPIGTEQSPPQHGGECGRCSRADQAAVKAEFAGPRAVPADLPRNSAETPG
jgi:hypothetical protein